MALVVAGSLVITDYMPVIMQSMIKVDKEQIKPQNHIDFMTIFAGGNNE